MRNTFGSAISQSDRRTLRLGVLVVATIAILGRGIPALIEAERQGIEEAVQLQAALERARAAIHELSSSSPTSAVAPSPEAIAADSPTIAAALLARIVNEAVAASGAELGTVQVLDELPAARGFWRAGVRAQLTGSLESVALVLADLEDRDPVLRIGEMAISRGAAAQADQTENLNVTLVVEALVRPTANVGAPR